MKVLIAPVHIGGQLSRYENALNICGVKAVSMSFYTNRFNDKATINLELDRKPKKLRLLIRVAFLFYSIINYDVFHLFYGESLLPNNYDLMILKIFKKKVLMNFWGSEIRDPKIAHARSKYYVNSYSENSIRSKALMRAVSKYIDIAVVQDMELYEYVKPFFKKVFILRATCEDNYNRTEHNLNGKITITHLPSQREFKGSSIIAHEVNKLKESNSGIDFKLYENKKMQEIRDFIQCSDIIIDQIRIGTHGIVTVEAFSMGRPVICYIREDLKDKYPRDLPIINANPDNLYEVLSELISSRENINKIADESRAYFKKYHSFEVIGKELINIYRKL